MFDYTKIPEDMKKTKRWVLWKTRPASNNKLTKIPINAQSGYGAKSNDESTWVSFDEAISKVDYYKCSGLGFMLGNGYFGVDLDDVIENKELVNDFALTLKSFTEFSQSGKGIHIICKGVLPVGARRKGNIEMYDSARFFALTGNVPKEFDFGGVFERTEEAKTLWEKYLNEKPKEVPEGAYVYQREKSTSTKVPANLNDDELIIKATESKNGALFNVLYYGQWEGLYPSQSEADMAFASLLAFWSGKNPSQMDRVFRQSKLYRPKWDVKRGIKTYGQITIENACNRCQDVYEVFSDDNSKVYNAKTGEVYTKKHYDLNDTGNALRFIDKFGDGLRYNYDNKVWMIWDGKTWEQDNKQIIKNKVDLMIEEMKEEAIMEPNESYMKELMKNIKHLSSFNGKESMLKEAMHTGITATVNADYDKDLYKINCLNGVIDLKTGELLPHDKSFMMAKNTGVSVDLENEPTLWKKSLLQTFKGSQDLVDFVHKAVGYSLTGDTKEQCFFQCYGNGSNGKSVFFNIMHAMFGDYILNAQVESILTRGKSNGGGASPDIARMNGARFVRTNEPSEGSRFNEGLVKQLTGGDVITARFLYGGEFEFKPVFKMWIAANYKIVVRGTDKGIWRRMRLIPFEAVFEGKNDDKNIEKKLLKELPQILGWAVKGCLEWQKNGLPMPKEIEEATLEYREEMDIVESFIKDEVKISLLSREKAGDVFKAYKDWAMLGNEYFMSQSKFGVEMGKRFEKKVIGGYVYYLGIILKKNDKSYVFEKNIY